MRELFAIGSSLLVLLGMTSGVGAQAACPAGQPCINSVGISKSRALVANIVNTNGYEVMHLRWSRPGRDGGQKEYRAKDGSFVVFPTTTRGVTYTVAVQGCNKRALQSSRCSGWDRATVTAK